MAGAGAGAGAASHAEDVLKQLEDHAIPFITVPDDDDIAGSNAKFDVNPDALRYLETLTGKVAVVAIAGRYRSGKSYVLGRLCGTGASFTVGSTVKACTKGIWLWGKAVEVDGADYTVLFLDTEGLGSTIRGATYDCRIFALALLLSSFFIYNSVGVIDGDAINQLNLVVNLTKHIHVRSHADSEDSGVEFNQFFPNFLWVVRDFGVRLERNGVRMSPRDYLEDALKPESGMSEAAEQKNSVRMLLRNFFPERDCVTMVRPVTDEVKLGRLASLPDDDLRPEFRVQLDALKKRVFSAARPKTMFGQPLNGRMIGQLALQYVEALNTNQTPTIRSAWDRVAEQQCSDAYDAALASYTSAMKEPRTDTDAGAEKKHPLVLPASALEQLHVATYRHATDLYARDAVQDSDSFSEYEAQLHKSVQDAYAKIKKTNEAASSTFCEDLVNGLHKDVLVAGMDKDLSGDTVAAGALPRSLRKNLRSLVDQYRAASVGVAADRVLADHLTDHSAAVLRPYCDRLDTQLRDAAAAQEVAVEALRAELAEAHTHHRGVAKQLADAQDAAATAQAAAEAANSACSAKVDALQAELAAAKEHAQQAVAAKMEDIARLTAAKDAAVERLSQVQSQGSSALSDAQAASLTDRQEIGRLSGELKAVQAALDVARQDAQALHAKLESAQAQLLKATEEAGRSGRAAADAQAALSTAQRDAQDKERALEAELKAARSQVDTLQRQKEDAGTALVDLVRNLADATKTAVADAAARSEARDAETMTLLRSTRDDVVAAVKAGASTSAEAAASAVAGAVPTAVADAVSPLLADVAHAAATAASDAVAQAVPSAAADAVSTAVADSVVPAVTDAMTTAGATAAASASSSATDAATAAVKAAIVDALPGAVADVVPSACSAAVSDAAAATLPEAVASALAASLPSVVPEAVAAAVSDHLPAAVSAAAADTATVVAQAAADAVTTAAAAAAEASAAAVVAAEAAAAAAAEPTPPPSLPSAATVPASSTDAGAGARAGAGAGGEAGPDAAEFAALKKELVDVQEQLESERQEHEHRVSLLSDHLSRAVAKAGKSRGKESPKVAKVMEDSLALAKQLTEAERAKAAAEAALAATKTEKDGLTVRLTSTQSLVKALEAEKEEMLLQLAGAKADVAHSEEGKSHLQADVALLSQLAQQLKKALVARGSVKLQLDAPLLHKYHAL